MKNKKLVSLTLTAIMALSATAFAACGGGEDFTNDPTTWESLQSGEMVKIVFAGRDVDSEKINYQNFLNEFNLTNELSLPSRRPLKSTLIIGAVFAVSPISITPLSPSRR